MMRVNTTACVVRIAAKRYNSQPFQKASIFQYKKKPLLRTFTTTIARFQIQCSRKLLTKGVERGRNTFISSNRNATRQSSISTNTRRKDEKEKLSKQIASLLKIAGIPILMFSLYQVGYHQVNASNSNTRERYLIIFNMFCCARVYSNV